MSKLLEKLRKNTIVDAQLLKNSKYFDEGKFIATRVPLLNLALSGKIRGGGLPKGIVQIAAPPKHFKTNFMLELMLGFQNDPENADQDYIIVLYDSELGSTPSYYEKMGLDTSKIDHRPIKSVEELRSDIANLLNDISEGDKVLICVDSIGMLRSNKETEDAKSGHDAADMTRAKALNSLFRIITAESAIKQIPIVIINHSYGTLEMFSKEVASGGRKTQYAAHTLLFITKAQDKEKEDGKDVLKGFRFTLRAGLSRYVKENATFPITVHFGEGVDPFSGLFDLALDLGYIVPQKQGWYKMKNWPEENKQVRRADLEEDEDVMNALLEDDSFCAAVEKIYSL